MSFAVVTSPRRERLVRFFLVGATAAILQTALLSVFVDFAGINYLLSAAVAIELTILFNYVFNNAWTFYRSRHNVMQEYLAGLIKTNLVRGTAIPIQMSILYALVTFAGTGLLVGNGIAILLTAPYRYILDASWTWN